MMHAPSPLLLTIMCTIQGHMLRPHNYQLLWMSFNDAGSASIATFVHTIMSTIPWHNMLHLHSYLPLCLPFKDICSVSIATHHYVCHSGTYDLPPYLLTIMSAIQRHMLRLHSYSPLCLPFRNICSASITTYHYAYHPVTYALPP